MEVIPINGLSNFFSGLDWSVPVSILMSVIPALICITFHELSHGFVAYKLGDTTARDMGRLTLNPIKHIDILGLIMMATVGFGWAKPVPVNMYRFKNPKAGMAVTALAGPLSNVLLAAFILLIYGFVYIPLYELGTVGYYIMQMIQTTAYLSCALAIFNIIPISPLDGSKVLFSFLPSNTYDKLMRYERFGMILLIVIVYLDILTPFLTTATQWLYGGLIHIAQWSLSLTL